MLKKETIVELQEDMGDIRTLQDFESVFRNVLSNPTLQEILWEDGELLQERVKKILLARRILSTEKYDAIWEEWITSPDMTLEKIWTIGIGEIRCDGSIHPNQNYVHDGGLNLEQIHWMGWKNLAHKGMTADKISLFTFWALPNNISPEAIADMPESDMYSLLF